MLFRGAFLVIFIIDSLLVAIKAEDRAACPQDSTIIAPCSCSRNETNNSSYPDLYCVNYSGTEGNINVDSVFSSLSDYLDQENRDKLFTKLLLVNGHVTQLNQSVFHGISYQDIRLYEDNLTRFAEDTFEGMNTSLKYFLLKGNQLGNSVFGALNQVQSLKDVTLNLGVDSFKTIPSNALANLPRLRKVVINGMTETISSNAFTNLANLEYVRITDMLETIDPNAFVFGSENGTREIRLDLSDNRLSETSIDPGFIEFDPNIHLDLDLSDNRIRYLAESVFRDFFTINDANRLNVKSNMIECGRCEAYWLIQERSLVENRLEIQCDFNQTSSFWEFDWSHCASNNNDDDDDNNPGSGSTVFTISFSLLSVCTLIQSVYGF